MKKSVKNTNSRSRNKERKKRPIGRWVLLLILLCGLGYVLKTKYFANLPINEKTAEVIAKSDSSKVEIDPINVEELSSVVNRKFELFGHNYRPLLVKYLPARKIKIKGLFSIQENFVYQSVGKIEGLSLYDLDLSNIEKKLESHSRIKNAVVQRRFPDYLVVRIEERQEKALLIADHHVYGLDSEGYVMASPIAGWIRDYPVITGFKQKAKIGQQLEEENIIEALTWVKQMQSEPEILNWITSIHLGKNKIDYLQCRSNCKVTLGKHYPQAQIAAMKSFLNNKEEDYYQNKILDLRFSDFIIIKSLSS